MTVGRDRSGAAPALAGLVSGAAGVAALAVIAFLGTGREPPAQLVMTSVLIGLFAAPFLVSLFAFVSAPSEVRGGVWLGAGIFSAFSALLSAISFVSLLVLPAAILLIVGGAREPHGASRRFALALLAVLAAGAVSVTAWFGAQERRCWYRAGDVWVERPYRSTIVITSQDPFTEATCGGYVTGAGAAISIGAWAAATGAVLFLRESGRIQTRTA